MTAEGRDFQRVEAGQHGVDVRLRHRELSGAQVEKRMAERVDARAVHIRHGSGGAHLEIAANERDADRIARPQRFNDRGGQGLAGARRAAAHAVGAAG